MFTSAQYRHYSNLSHIHQGYKILIFMGIMVHGWTYFFLPWNWWWRSISHSQIFGRILNSCTLKENRHAPSFSESPTSVDWRGEVTRKQKQTSNKKNLHDKLKNSVPSESWTCVSPTALKNWVILFFSISMCCISRNKLFICINRSCNKVIHSCIFYQFSC